MYSSIDSVTEMTSGNLVHSSCMVTHGSGNGDNAKSPDKICECVSLNCLNCKMETRTIECVAFFYHEGAKGDDFIQKNKFRCCNRQTGKRKSCAFAHQDLISPLTGAKQ